MPAAAPARRLRLCNQHQPLPRTVIGAGTQGGVGAGQAVNHLNLQSVHRVGVHLGGNGGGVEHIDIFRQGVAAVGHGLDGDAVAAQRRHCLPDCRAADAQPGGQLLPGDILPADAVQRRQHLLLDHS